MKEKELRVNIFILAIAGMILLIIVSLIDTRSKKIVLDNVEVFYYETQKETGSYDPEIDGNNNKETIENKVSFENSVDNPENASFVVELQFNEDTVTQELFNKRYEIK